MHIGAYLPQSLVLALLVLLIWAGLSDIRSLRIPNTVPAALLVLYPIHVLASPTAPDWPGALLVLAIVFAVGFALFAKGWFGGGDVKLLSAVALWAGPEQIAAVLVVTALAGAGLSLVVRLLQVLMPWLTAGFLVAAPAGGTRTAPRLHVPYGVAIALGGGFLAIRLLTSLAGG